MKLTVIRHTLDDKCTIGDLLVDGEFQCHTLEDVVRPEGAPKVFGETAIPYGTYEVTVTFSNHFQRDLPLLRNVPGFEGVRIHPGNTAADTEGCLLVGTGESRDAITGSRAAFDALWPQILEAHSQGEPITIEYVEEHNG